MSADGMAELESMEPPEATTASTSTFTPRMEAKVEHPTSYSVTSMNPDNGIRLMIDALTAALAYCIIMVTTVAIIQRATRRNRK
jgi:hypothetical protein